MIHSAGNDKAAIEKLHISVFESFMTSNVRVYRFVFDAVDRRTVIFRKDGVHDVNTEPQRN